MSFDVEFDIQHCPTGLGFEIRLTRNFNLIGLLFLESLMYNLQFWRKDGHHEHTPLYILYVQYKTNNGFGKLYNRTGCKVTI